MEDLQRKKLEKLVKELEKFRGRHTELITVYIPQGFNILKVAEQLRNEQSTAQNIKSKATRKNVLAALEKILQHLKFYRETPKNGLAIFCGNTAESEGEISMEIWAIEPPEPVHVRLYRCDQAFVMDPLKEMLRETEIYGLIVLDKSEAEIGLLSGKRVESLKHLDSIVPGKTKVGGWSQARYARVREGLLNDFMKKVAEIANAQFKGLKDMKGIIIGGPGLIKNDFANGEYLDYSLKKMLLGIVDTSYSGEPGLKEIVEGSSELIKEASVMMEKKILDRYFDELAKDGLAIYGFDDVSNALKAGNVELLLISEAFDWVEAKLKCRNCGAEAEKTIKEEFLKEEKCEECGGSLETISKKELMDDIIAMGEKISTVVEIISTDTPRGAQLKELGCVGAILRYKV